MRRRFCLTRMPGKRIQRGTRAENLCDSGFIAIRRVGAMPHDDDARLAQESEFLSEFGGRVRELRALHGLSRRELARRSGLSERYVAMIEAGKGNVSIVRLLRIALVFSLRRGGRLSGPRKGEAIAYGRTRSCGQGQ